MNGDRRLSVEIRSGNRLDKKFGMHVKLKTLLKIFKITKKDIDRPIKNV